MSSNYRTGEFFIDAISIVTQSGDIVDIRNVTAAFQLYESIYDMFTTGEVSLVDTQNILRTFEFTGQEFIRISVRQKEGLEDKSEKDFSIDKTFRIYKTLNVQKINEVTQTYTLLFADPRLFQAEKTKVSQSFYGSYSAMALGVMSDIIKFTPEETEAWVDTLPANFSFLAPDWTVKKSVEYFVENANTSTEAPFRNSCFFYQTLNGGFRFHDIGEMYQRVHPVVFSTSPKNTELDSMSANINSAKGLNTQILKYEQPSTFNTLEGIRKGLYASTIRIWNPIEQRLDEKIYDMSQTFAREGHMHNPNVHLDAPEIVMTTDDAIGNEDQSYSQTDAEPALNQAYDSLVINVDTMKHAFGNAKKYEDAESFLGEVHEDNSILERRALLELLKQNVYTVQVPFRTDLTVGTVVRLNIHEPETSKPEGTGDKKNDNKYLITSMKITGIPKDNKGTITMDCVREGISKKLQPSISE